MVFATSYVANVAGVTLGVLFIIAGIAKIGAGERWWAQAADLGVPRPIAAAVPWLEIAIGTTVAFRVAMPWPAVAAIALLLAFTVFIVARLRDGDRPPCACFGVWSAAPLSGWHVARNVCMIALGVLTIVVA